MLIGKKDTFAIEYELDSNYGGEWAFGKICYWINSTQIGDYELGTSLRDVLVAMVFLVPDCGNREGLNLCKLPPEKIFSQLNEAIFGENENLNDLPDAPARFNINIQVDVFDNWKIFLVDCDCKSIFVFKNINEEKIYHLETEKGEFDSVVKEFYNRLELTCDSVNNSSSV